MNRSIELKMMAGFGLVFLCLILLSITRYWVSGQREDLGGLVNRTHETRVQIERTMLCLIDAESDERSSLLVRSTSHWNAIQNDTVSVWKEFRRLQFLTRDNPVQQENLHTFHTHLEQRFALRAEVLRLSQQGNPGAALQVMVSPENERQQKALAEVVAAMEREEEHLLARQIAASSAYNRRSETFLLALRFLMMGILTAIFFAVRANNRKRQEEYLRLEAAEKKVREISFLQTAILNNASVAILSTDINGIIQSMNATSERWLGYTKEEAIGKISPCIFHDPQEVVRRAEELSRKFGRTIEPGWEVFTANLCAGSPEEHEWTYIRKDGSRFSVLLSLTALRDEEADIVGYMGIISDITERKKEQEERETLAAVMENAHDFIAMASLEGQILFVNRAGRRMTGIGETEDIRSLHILTLSTEETWQTTRDVAQPAVRETGFWQGEGQLRNQQTGEVLDVEKTIFMVRHPQTGEPLCIASTQRDITAQRQAQCALQKSEERQRRIFDEAAVGMKILALDGTLLEANRTLCAMLGYAQDELIGRHFRDFTFPEDIACSEGALARLLSGEIAEATLEKRCLHRDGSLVYVLLKESLLRDQEGRPQSVSSQVINITERIQAEQALRESERRLEEAQHIAKIGNWEYDLATGKITWSKELFLLVGLDPAQGEPDYETNGTLYCPEDAVQLDTCVHLAIAEGIPYKLDLRGATAEGEPIRWYQAVGNPVFDSAGKVIRLVGILIDITERKQAERTLAETGERLRLATEAGEMGVFDYDIATTALTWDEHMMRLFAFTPETFPGAYEAWSERLHPDDKAQAVAELMETIQSGRKFDTEFRIVLPGGVIRYIKADAVVLHDENGSPRRVIGLNKDITPRKHAERTLENLNRQNTLLLESIGEGIYGIDAMGQITFVNPAAASMFGYDPEEMLGQNMHELAHHTKEDGTPYPSADCPIYQALNGGEVRRTSNEVFWRKDGTFFPVEYVSTPIREDGQVVGLVVSFQDVTERRQHLREIQAANSQLEQQILRVNEQAAELEDQKSELEEINFRLEMLATIDGLTGIKNHRAFQEQMVVDFERSKRYGEPLSLLLMDVDKFKTFNDTFGHPAGDKVLKTFAQLLQECARDGDFVARYGGEEFVIILPETEDEGALQAAERFRAAIEAYSWEERKITVSIGVSTLYFEADTAQTLILGADKALYQSKQEGRNRVTHARDVEEENLSREISKSINEALIQTLTIQSEMLPFAVEEVRETMVQAYDATVESWCHIVDMKDKETEGHSERVTQLMERFAKYVNMTADEARYARWGALLHDIGKIAVPDSILHKPGPLNEEEWAIMRRHPSTAQEMLSGITFLKPALEIPYGHHEKWDGTGYPCGLKGEAIPFAARLFAVIDVYDALKSDRPYRKGWSEQEVQDHLRSQSSSHFDPRAVNAFLAMLAEQEIQEAAEPKAA